MGKENIKIEWVVQGMKHCEWFDIGKPFQSRKDARDSRDDLRNNLPLINSCFGYNCIRAVRRETANYPIDVGGIDD